MKSRGLKSKGLPLVYLLHGKRGESPVFYVTATFTRNIKGVGADTKFLDSRLPVLVSFTDTSHILVTFSSKSILFSPTRFVVGC
jgi:hypothetical protein